jgi:hypothetical protein
MRENDVTALLEGGGLNCNLGHLGGSFHWVNFYELARGRSLAVEFYKSPGRIAQWEGGLLHAAYITAWTGEKVLSITLTNAP